MVPYKNIIDYAIEGILYSGAQYRYLVLKKLLDEYLNTNLSFKTFDNHIKKMVNGRILKKKGKFYYLTQESRNRLARGETIDAKYYDWRRRAIGTTITDTIKDDNQYL
jgi:hypothetical protein